MPPGVKSGCQEHEQSERDSGNRRKPGIDTCGHRQDQPQRAQDLDDADDLDEGTRHVLDPGEQLPGLLITKALFTPAIRKTSANTAENTHSKPCIQMIHFLCREFVRQYTPFATSPTSVALFASCAKCGHPEVH